MRSAMTWKVLTQVVESIMPIMCYFNLCIILLIYLNARPDNVIQNYRNYHET